MKKIVSTFVILISLTACDIVASRSEVTGTSFKNDTAGISFDVPYNWLLLKDISKAKMENGLAFGMKNEKVDFNGNFYMVYTEHKGTPTLETISKEAFTAWDHQFYDAELSGEQEINIDNHKCMEFTISYTSQRIDLESHFLVIIRDKYDLLLVHTEDSDSSTDNFGIEDYEFIKKTMKIYEQNSRNTEKLENAQPLDWEKIIHQITK
jgi:hypothetical protein